MADVTTVVRLGMPAGPAKILASGTARELMALGISAELAKLIVADGDTERLMALGIPATLAVQVNALII